MTDLYGEEKVRGVLDQLTLLLEEVAVAVLVLDAGREHVWVEADVKLGLFQGANSQSCLLYDVSERTF